MGGLRPIGSEKLEGMDKIRRIMEIARYNESIPQPVNEDKKTEKINLISKISKPSCNRFRKWVTSKI